MPDIIDEAPAKSVEVKYKKSNKEAKLGNELTPKDVRETPEVTFEADHDAFYTLIMTDPDAPSRKNPIRREFHHWLVGNIPGNSVNKGNVLSAYVGSGPPKNTGLHRYVFLVYKQQGKIDFDEPILSKNDGKSRGNFSAKKFAEKYKLGNPIAGNFYQAQYDDSVPALHKQLGF